MKKVTTLGTLVLIMLFLAPSFVNAQQTDTVRSLIISENGGTAYQRNYTELANVGDDPVNLSNFEYGTIRGWRVDAGEPYPTPDNRQIRFLPDTVLQPGETFLIASVYDFNDKYRPLHNNVTWGIIKENVDLPVYHDEDRVGDNNGKDKISKYHHVLIQHNGHDIIYLEYE